MKFGLILTILRTSLTAALSTGAALAQQPALPVHPAAGTPTYRISGRVVDAHTGSPLGHCSVQAANIKDRGESQTVNSDESGNFSFAGLPRGKYSLTAERHGYTAQSFEEHEQFSTAIAVGPGLDSEGLTFKLTAEAIITGTVTDEAGEPVRAAQVRLFQDQNVDGMQSTVPRHAVVTDDRGMYELADLHPGAYFLVVTAHPWYAQQSQAEPETGQAGENSGVQALDVGYLPTFYPATTDEDSASPIPIKGGDHIEADVTLTPQPALRLRLSLPPIPREPNRSPTVSVARSVLGQSEYLPLQLTYHPDGTVELGGVLPGHYDVTIGGYGNNGQLAPGATHFEADIATGATELSAESEVGEVTITGKVTSIAGKLPLAGITLRALQKRQQHFTRINEGGEFTVTVPPGAYEVIGAIPGLYFASLKATGASLAGRTLTVKAGDAPVLEIVAAAGHGEIEGTVLSGAKPASAVMVLLAPEDPKHNQALFRRDQSDSDGTFDLPNVVPGRYRLLAIENGWDLEWANPAVLQTFLAKSVAIEVKAADHLNQAVQAQAR